MLFPPFPFPPQCSVDLDRNVCSECELVIQEGKVDEEYDSFLRKKKRLGRMQLMLSLLMQCPWLLTLTLFSRSHGTRFSHNCSPL